MKHTILLIIIPFLVISISNCKQPQARKLIRITTDHGGNTSDISTDELILNYSDGTKENITNNDFMDRVPVISYDDSTLAFIRRRDSNNDSKVNWDDKEELWIMNLSNREQFHISPGSTNISQATWHSSKNQLAFIATRGDTRGLFLYDIVSKSHTLVSKEADSWPTWSRDGKHIAFYNNKNQVVILNTESSQTKVLSPDVGNGWALYWTLDNKLIFIQEPMEWHIFTPDSDRAITIEESEYLQLTKVTQEEFGWATKMQNKSQ